MMAWARRVFDPHGAAPARVALRQAVAVGFLVFAACLVAGQWPAAVLFGSAAFAAVLGVALQVVRGLAGTRQELRDLWGLGGVIIEQRPWPSPGGWGLGADALAYLLRVLPERGAQLVLELGPGTSSVVLGRCLPGVRFIGFEHNEKFFHAVSANLRLHELKGYELRLVPLHKVLLQGKQLEWYDPAAVDNLPDGIDVLVVDGPPNLSGRGNRSAAWSLLRDRLSMNALILVDDTHRRDERKMVQTWLRDGELVVEHDGGNFMVLERRARVAAHS